MSTRRSEPRMRPPFGRKPTAEEFSGEEGTPPPFDTSDAVAQLWNLRALPEQIERLNAAVGGYTSQVERHELLIAQWSGAAQECIADIETATRRHATMEGELTRFFHSEWPHLRSALAELSSAIRTIGDRMTKLELCVANIGSAQESQAAKIVSLDTRVLVLEGDKHDRGVVVAERRRLISGTRVLFAAVAAALGYLINWLT